MSFRNAMKELLNFQAERKEFLKEKLDLIADDIEKSKEQNADIVKYTTEFLMSVVDPSYIYDKCIGGVKKVRLLEKVLKEIDEVLELGFSKDGRCLYEKIIGTDRLQATFVYKENIIYEIYLDDFMYSSFFEFDEYNRVKFIQRGYEMTEEYQWLNDYIAIVSNCINGDLVKYLLIKNKHDVLAIFSLCENYDADVIKTKETKYRTSQYRS